MMTTPEPYAVVEKTQTKKRPLDASSNSNGNHEDAKDEEKDFAQLYAKVDKTSNKQGKPEQHHVNNNNHKRTNSDAGDDDDFGALYATVDKGRKTITVIAVTQIPKPRRFQCIKEHFKWRFTAREQLHLRRCGRCASAPVVTSGIM